MAAPTSSTSAAITAGYSGTPLAKKLGYKAGYRAALIAPPADYRAMVEPLLAGVEFQQAATGETDLVHVFTTDRTELGKHLNALRLTLKPDACVWVSWPKKSAKLASTVTEDTIRELALPLGFVDIKVCAVNQVWSGLKLVVRKALR